LGSVDVIELLPSTRSAQSLKAGRKSRGRNSDSDTFDPVVVRAGGDRVSAGQTLVGEVLGEPGPVSVDLVRIEQTPSGQRLHSCQRATAVSAWSATDTNPARATFELEVPENAVPSARGAQCSLSYALRARLQGAGPGRHWAAVEVLARGQAHVERRFRRFDRFLASVPARSFHIELNDARPVGGGYIAGRVHQHGPRPLGSMAVTVRCTEAWRSLPPWRGAPPDWDENVLWTASVPIELDDDRRWSPFRYEIPAGLPAATEALTVAWRYELVVSRRIRHWPDQHATLTPLLFEAA
jgi:hypothetical protein